MAVEILMMGPMGPVERGLESDFTVYMLPPEPERAAFLAEKGASIRGIVAYSGASLVSPAFLDRVPNVEIIANMGVGYESIDVPAAHARKIIVTNAGSVNAEDVGEAAFGLVLATARRIAAGDAYVRAGNWLSKGRMPMTHRVTGRKMGILGLGSIGLVVAKRAAAFDMEVSYHNRRRRADVPYRYFESLVEMAKEVDFLVAATPGGEWTKHLIDRAVIDALGPEGIVVNVGRGTVIDEKAMVAALVEGRLGGAGLDVLESEPKVPPELIEMQNVVLQPHVGGATHEGVGAAIELVIKNLKLHFGGQAVLTPVVL